MPNWVRNRIILNGEKAEEVLKDHFTRDENGHLEFDFSTIESMPEELLIGKGSRSINGFKLYLAKLNPAIPNIGEATDKLEYLAYSKKLLEVFGQSAKEDLIKYTLKPSEVEELKVKYGNQFDEVLSLGEKVFSNKQKYGVLDWYDWSCEHWGTKWNASLTKIVEDCVYFDTAWSPAIPAIEKLAKMHPNLDIEYSFSEEQASVLCGTIRYENGECIEEIYYPEGGKEAFELFFDLWEEEDRFCFDTKSGTYVYKGDEEEMQ